MQANSRTNPTKGPRSGLAERKEFEYRRNGTGTLFAALDVHSGEVPDLVGKDLGRRAVLVLPSLASHE
jgi:hypothetical protein